MKWTFPKKKKKRNKTRIRIAYDKERKSIVDFEIGDKSRKTFRRLRKKLKKYDVEVYFSDDREAYQGVLPEEKHIAHKSGTCSIEGLNNCTRHHIARLHRKTHCYGKCLNMIKYTLLLFMYEGIIISMFT